MISHLSIRNYALIEHLEIDFNSGLNILTGETGSGKSIILGALGLILGERADIKAVAEGQKKCIVEGTFDLDETIWRERFEKLDLEFEEPTIIRREIRATGKSRAFINDSPVSLAVMKEIGQRMVDIHSQHHTLQLNDPGFQLGIIDYYTDSEKILTTYRQVYGEYKSLSHRLKSAKDDLHKRMNELEFLKFQHEELAAAQLNDYDEEAVDEEYNRLANAEEIAEKLSVVVSILTEGESPVASALKTATDKLQELSEYSKTYKELAERLESTRIELTDIAREVESDSEGVEVNPKRLDLLNERRATIFRLERKYDVKGVCELRKIHSRLETDIAGASDLEISIEEIETALGAKSEELQKVGEELTRKRATGLLSFSTEIIGLLRELNMKQAKFEVDLTKLEQPSLLGFDAVEMKFTANAGRPTEPIKKVASGGELSRLMLAIKKMAASGVKKTIVLDEIDTGVSGEVAHAMGRIMKEMAGDMQVISITHLPQIASKGGTHFKVSKSESDGITKTRIEKLNSDERVQEIARMLSGEETTNAAMVNARELLEKK